MSHRLLSSLGLGAALLTLTGCFGVDTEPAPLRNPSTTTTTTPEVCELPPVVGDCEAAIPRWHHDPASKGCVEFVYGGCGGNQNNFASKEACETACEVVTTEPVYCGGWSGPTCTATEFCDFAQDGCDYADASGICAPRPQACDDVYDPVCGCNGQTYGNLCEAQAAGVDAAASGTCEGACEDTSRDPIVLGGTRTFGFCQSDCESTLSVTASPLDAAFACDVVRVEVCDNGSLRNCTESFGTLTAAGHDEARAVAAALENVNLERTYGCPDCADGGASTVGLQRGSGISLHTYDFGGPPRELEAADAFVQSLIDDLRACRATSRLVPDASCQPR